MTLFHCIPSLLPIPPVAPLPVLGSTILYSIVGITAYALLFLGFLILLMGGMTHDHHRRR